MSTTKAPAWTERAAGASSRLGSPCPWDVLPDPRAKGDPDDEGIVVIGAGGHALVVAAAIVASGSRVAGLYDDDPSLWGRSVGGHPVVGPIGELEGSERRAIVAIGSNAVRRRISERLALDWVTVVHPFTWVAPDVRLGRGAFVGAGALVQPSSAVGEHAIVNSRAGVGHHAIVEPFAHLSVAYLGSGARAGEGALLAIGSSVLPSLSVGRWATVGAGALVTHDVPDGVTVVGIPARPQPVLEPASA